MVGNLIANYSELAGTQGFPTYEIPLRLFCFNVVAKVYATKDLFEMAGIAFGDVSLVWFSLFWISAHYRILVNFALCKFSIIILHLVSIT